VIVARLIVVAGSFVALALAARLAGAQQTKVVPNTQFGVEASTQFAAPDARGTKLGKDVTQRYQIGMLVSAQGGPCQGIYATAPVPTDWPEQTVQVITEDISPNVQKIDYRIIGGTVKQMLVSMPYIAPGQEVKALVTLEIRRYSLLPPDDTSIFVLPNERKLSKEMRQYLAESVH